MSHRISILIRNFPPGSIFPKLKRPKYNFIKNGSFRPEKMSNPVRKQIFEGIAAGSSEELMAHRISFSGHENRLYPRI